MRAEHLFSILGLVDPALTTRPWIPPPPQTAAGRLAPVRGRCRPAASWSARLFCRALPGHGRLNTLLPKIPPALPRSRKVRHGKRRVGRRLPSPGPRGGFFSYAGPVLPLTTLEPDTGLTAERTLTLDFAPGTHADGASSQWGAAE
jgi:hypothetical protein